MKHLQKFEDFNYQPIDLPVTGYAPFDGEEEDPFIITDEDWIKYPFYSGLIGFYFDGNKSDDNIVYKAIIDRKDPNLQDGLKNLVYEFGGDYYNHKEEINELVEDLIYARKHH